MIYFCVFVLSFSRLLYVGVCLKPVDTLQLIRFHDEAFRYFGGLPEECLYDQTKLVVINERYRELEDRKSTRLNSSHVAISYAVFCLKKKTRKNSSDFSYLSIL